MTQEYKYIYIWISLAPFRSWGWCLTLQNVMVRIWQQRISKWCILKLQMLATIFQIIRRSTPAFNRLIDLNDLVGKIYRKPWVFTSSIQQLATPRSIIFHPSLGFFDILRFLVPPDLFASSHNSRPSAVFSRNSCFTSWRMIQPEEWSHLIGVPTMECYNL